MNIFYRVPFVHKITSCKQRICFVGVTGAQSVGYPGVVSEMFPLGGSDLVLYFYSVCNQRLSEYLRKKTENESPDSNK